MKLLVCSIIVGSFCNINWSNLCSRQAPSHHTINFRDSFWRMKYETDIQGIRLSEVFFVIFLLYFYY